ncbi:unnamed protein product [Moneuplotes crassus]|uniref:Tubulin-tyrosine ligase family protein n=1 Tax=Euplotes crassus TaxID=5936 RepID=A0AAD1U0G2_EUPCR|nr:unnamed protein product [Moneuplotes crassus]
MNSTVDLFCETINEESLGKPRFISPIQRKTQKDPLLKNKPARFSNYPTLETINRQKGIKRFCKPNAVFRAAVKENLRSRQPIQRKNFKLDLEDDPLNKLLEREKVSLFSKISQLKRTQGMIESKNFLDSSITPENTFVNERISMAQNNIMPTFPLQKIRRTTYYDWKSHEYEGDIVSLFKYYRNKNNYTCTNFNKTDKTPQSISPYAQDMSSDTARVVRKFRNERNFSTALKKFENNLSKYMPQSLAGQKAKDFKSLDTLKTEPKHTSNQDSLKTDPVLGPFHTEIERKTGTKKCNIKFTNKKDFIKSLQQTIIKITENHNIKIANQNLKLLDGDASKHFMSHTAKRAFSTSPHAYSKETPVENSKAVPYCRDIVLKRKKGLYTTNQEKEAYFSQDKLKEESKKNKVQCYLTSNSNCRSKEHKPGFSYNLNYIKFDNSKQTDTDDENGISETIRPYIVKKPKQDHLRKFRKYLEKHYSGTKIAEIRSRISQDHLPNSNFNLILNLFNEFILITQKRRNSLFDFELIKDICKAFKLPKPRGIIDNNFITMVKEKVFQSFLYHINFDNCLYEYKWTTIKADFQKKTIYKAYICRGNNGKVVKNMLKRRWWWSFTSKPDPRECDFIFTQWLRPNIVRKLKHSKDNLTDSQFQKISFKEDKQEFKHSCIYNKIPENYNLANKKNLFLNLVSYYKSIGKDPNEFIPETYLIKSGPEHPSFIEFKLKVKGSDEGCWIIKPGENSNRGRGIKLCSTISELEACMQNKCRSYIIQKYIHNPLLINKRKFDIRVFGLFTQINECQKGYFFQDGYLRTASKEFTCKNIYNRFIHLTNDAVQKKSDSYGKYETSNKLSYNDLEKYLRINFKDISFYRDIYPQIKQLVRDSFLSVYNKMGQNRINAFEIFGYDFMIDENFKVYLIEVNTNPCLEINCSLLSSVISSLIDNTFRITLDPYYLYPFQFKDSKRNIPLTDSSSTLSKFELIFDENLEKDTLKSLKSKITRPSIKHEAPTIEECQDNTSLTSSEEGRNGL